MIWDHDALPAGEDPQATIRGLREARREHEWGERG